MKKLVSIGLLTWLCGMAVAQTPNASNFQKMVDFLPPAPNAAAIIKHSEIMLNKNTGSPAINIPLFTVKGIKLATQVSIGYSSTGIKVDEIASRVGMGWALNAGGVVTRTVRGWPDEDATRLAPPFTAAGDNCGTYSFLEKIASSPKSGGYDAEPDLFNFNMNGVSGSFVLDAAMNPVLIPAGKFRVEKNFAGTAWNFKITTTDGLVYYFGGTGATEKTKRTNTCGKTYDDYLANAWYLTKIEHPNGEVINFSYTAHTYAYETGVSETQDWVFFGPDYRDVPIPIMLSCPTLVCTPPAAPSTCINTVSTQGVLLSSISNTSTAISFSYTSRSDCGDKLLSSVSQTVNGQSLGTFNFSYNQQAANMTYVNEYAYGYNYTPYLVSLAELSSDLALSKTHKFVYNDPGGRPPRMSFSQDHWGYFNGQVNTTFIPKPTEFYLQARFPTATANREPSQFYAGKGMLSKIIYPTGGVDSIQYESNDEQDFVRKFKTYHEYNCTVTGLNYWDENAKTTTFTIDEAQVVEVAVTCITTSAGGYDTLHQKGSVTIAPYGGGTNVLDEYFDPAYTPGATYTRYLNSTSYTLPAGTYTMTYRAKGSTQSTNVKLKFYPQTFIPASKNKIVGGLRVKRVFTADSAGVPMIKKYYYANMDQLDVSSLLSTQRPVYNKDYETAILCETTTGGSLAVPINIYCQHTAMYSGSIANLFNYSSGLISYGTVVESVGENFEGGATETKFYANGDARPTVWSGNEILGGTLSNNSSPLNGKLKEETIYKKPVSGSLFPVKKTVYNYTLDTAAYTTLYGYTVNKKYAIAGWTPALPCSNNSDAIVHTLISAFDANRYQLESWWAHLSSQTETLYDENGTNPVTNTTNMTYGDPRHLQLTGTQTNNSKAQSITTVNTYPHNYTGTTVYDDMITKNIITPVISTTTSNSGNEVSKNVVSYTDAGSNNYVPGSVQKSAKGNALETEGTIDAYDANGNILQFTNKAGISTAIIWGYNYQYPVAQVVGATYSSAVAQLTGAGSSVAALQSMTGTTLQSALHVIRTGLPAANVTTYTYIAGVGVTSITDPNNKTNTYAYDAFNRLLTVKDQDGNVVKKNDYVYAVPDTIAGPKIYLNAEVTQSISCTTCVAGYIANPVTYIIRKGKYFSLTSQAAANAQAAADTEGQEYANKNAKCYSGATCTGVDYKLVNCVCEKGTKVCESTTNNGGGSYTVVYHYLWSDGSTSSGYTETFSCSGADKKMINCTCETGTKVCDGVTNNGGGSYTVSYHYHWSDGSNSSTINETFTCSGADKKMIGCTCETGMKVYTSSVLTSKGSNNGCIPGQWLCTFYYRWSDNSTSYPTTYTECSPVNCMPAD